MSVLTSVNGVPLYSTIEEALAWARSRGLSGFHTHSFQGQTGYMGGSSHSVAFRSIRPTSVIPTVASTVTTTSTTMSGGGGGGY